MVMGRLRQPARVALARRCLSTMFAEAPYYKPEVAPQPLRVAIAGVGTVGGGVAQILHTHRALLAERCGRALQLVAVADQRPVSALKEELRGHDVKHYYDAVEMAHEGDDIDVIVETIGGYGVALKVANGALSRGVSLVTANKAMLAVHASELASTAEGTGAKIGWEAAVGGGIPCIRALREGCAANRVSYAAGILNGTCNFILTTMKESGRGFDDVLAEAQALGYAETPPDLDVDGIDTAHKLALVAAVATGSLPSYDGVYTEGIRSITGEDVKLADELGFSIKLLGIASRIEPFEGDPGFEEDPFRPCVGEEAPDVHGKVGGKVPVQHRSGGKLESRQRVVGEPRPNPVVLQRVHPALIPKSAALGATHGVLNGLFTIGDFVGPVFTQGRGAGRDATASACVGDLIDLARGGASVPTFGVPVADLNTMDTADMGQRIGRYYLRVDGKADRKKLLELLQKSGIDLEKKTSTGEGLNNGFSGVITGVTKESKLMKTVLEPLGKAVHMIRVEGPW